MPETSRTQRIAIGVLGLALLFGPWLAAAAGARSNPIASENRALAKRPTWRGFATLKDVTNYAADHFPLRDNAIRADNKIGKVASGGAAPTGVTPGLGSTTGTTTPGVQVPLTIKGKQGWLYLGEDLSRDCNPEIPVKEAMAGLRRLASILQKSGRTFVFTVIPDKTTSQTEFLPNSYPLQECATAAKADRQKQLKALKLPGYVDMFATVKASQTSTGVPAYLQHDTHWTDRTGAYFVKALAEKIDPAVAAGTQIQFAHPSNHKNDLAIFEGDESLFDDPTYEIARDGVTSNVAPTKLAPGDAYEIRGLSATASGKARVVTPRTLWIGDSFSDHAIHQIAPYFANGFEMPDLMKAKDVGKTTDGKDLYAVALPRMLAEIKSSKIVVMASVERFFFGQRAGSLLTADFLDQLEAALR